MFDVSHSQNVADPVQYFAGIRNHQFPDDFGQTLCQSERIDEAKTVIKILLQFSPDDRPTAKQLVNDFKLPYPDGLRESAVSPSQLSSSQAPVFVVEANFDDNLGKRRRVFMDAL